MKFPKTLSGPSNVNISGSSITDVAGDSHTYYYGDTYNKTSIHLSGPSQAGNQLRSDYSKIFQTLIVNSSRLTLANDLGPCFNGCHLRFPGAPSSSSMSFWDEEGSIGEDRNVGKV